MPLDRAGERSEGVSVVKVKGRMPGDLADLDATGRVHLPASPAWDGVPDGARVTVALLRRKGRWALRRVTVSRHAVGCTGGAGCCLDRDVVTLMRPAR